MKHKLSFFAILLMALALPHSVRAYDFSAVAPTGQTLYYNIVDDGAEVTTSPSSNRPTGDLTIPASVSHNGITYVVVSIGSNAFKSCSNLTSVIIPNSVTSIGGFAFSFCIGLTSVTIPNSVTSIGWRAFERCLNLTSVAIPNSVTSISEYAFSYCPGLTSISVDGGNTVYDSRNNCNAIIETATNKLIAGCKNTVIPNTVNRIYGAFEGCTGLASITIPNSVTHLDHAFTGCRGLTSISLPNSITHIGYYTFYECNGLTSITIPNSVTSIGGAAFSFCSRLTTVTIPSSVTIISDAPFSACDSLTSIIVADDNTVYDSRNNCNAIIHTATNKLISGCQNTVIPNTVTSIANSAFWLCPGLTSVTIPDAVTSIGTNAFWGINLTEVTCLATTPPSLGESAFSSILPSCTLTVPCGSEQAYQASDWGTYFTTIQCEEVGIGDVTWEGIEVALQGSALTIHGATGEPVTITDLMGRCLYSARATEPTHVALPSAGVYFVRVGDRPARKVVAARR